MVKQCIVRAMEYSVQSIRVVLVSVQELVLKSQSFGRTSFRFCTRSLPYSVIILTDGNTFCL